MATVDYTTFAGKYRLEEEIANGGCGQLSILPSSSTIKLLNSRLFFLQPGTVFLGVHTVAGKEVAIKIEPAVARNSPLKQESRIYKTLMGGTGVPWIMWSGKQGDYNVMIIDLLGPSLEDLFKMCNRHFSIKTVLLLADQLVRSFLINFQKRPYLINLLSPHNMLFRFHASSLFTPKTLSTAISNPQISSWVLESLPTSSTLSTLVSPKSSAMHAPQTTSPSNKTICTVSEPASLLLSIPTLASRPPEGTTSSPSLTCSSTSYGVPSHGGDSGPQTPSLMALMQLSIIPIITPFLPLGISFEIQRSLMKRFLPSDFLLNLTSYTNTRAALSSMTYQIMRVFVASSKD